MDSENIHKLLEDMENVKSLSSNLKENIGNIIGILNSWKQKLNKHEEVSDILKDLIKEASYIEGIIKENPQSKIDLKFFINNLEGIIKYLNIEKKQLEKNAEEEAGANDIDKIFINLTGALERNLLAKPHCEYRKTSKWFRGNIHRTYNLDNEIGLIIRYEGTSAAPLVLVNFNKSDLKKGELKAEAYLDRHNLESIRKLLENAQSEFKKLNIDFSWSETREKTWPGLYEFLPPKII